MLRFTELPEVKIALINRPNEAPTGSGENAMTAIPAAVANALFDATGARDPPAAADAGAGEGGDRRSCREERGRPRGRPSISPGEAALGDRPPRRGRGRARGRGASFGGCGGIGSASSRSTVAAVSGISTSISSASTARKRRIASRASSPSTVIRRVSHARRLADDVDPLRALGRERRDVPVALVLQQLEVDRERRRGRAGEHGTALDALLLVDRRRAAARRRRARPRSTRPGRGRGARAGRRARAGARRPCRRRRGRRPPPSSRSRERPRRAARRERVGDGREQLARLAARDLDLDRVGPLEHVGAP